MMLGVGCCFILTKKYFCRLKRLPSKVFMYGEEALLAESVRNTKCGKIYFDGYLKIDHNEHSSVKKYSDRELWKIQKDSSKEFLRSLKVLNSGK